MLNLSKAIEGLLMRLVIIVNTIFKLNSLNITVSVCYVSGSKVNRKERSCPFLSVCFLCFNLQSKSIAAHLVPSCQCHVWSLKQAEEVGAADDTSFFLSSFFFVFMLFYVILFVFFHVPGFSGMFRNVPGFVDARN